MPVRLEQISGLMIEKQEYVFINGANGFDSHTIHIKHEMDGYNKSIETMSKRQIGLNRERTAIRMFAHKNGYLNETDADILCYWNGISENQKKHWYETADAIIASEHELLEYKGSEV